MILEPFSMIFNEEIYTRFEIKKFSNWYRKLNRRWYFFLSGVSESGGEGSYFAPTVIKDSCKSDKRMKIISRARSTKKTHLQRHMLSQAPKKKSQSDKRQEKVMKSTFSGLGLQ